MFKKYEDKLSKNSKIIILLIFNLVLFFVYSLALFRMQIVKGEDYKTQSKTISSLVNTLPAQRGEIFDRDAKTLLVMNSDSFAVEVIPGKIPSDKYDTVMMKLANYLGITKAEIDEKIPKKSRKSYSSFQIRSNVPFSVISNIAENKSDLPGVSWISKPTRNYLHTASLSHVIGYVGDISNDEVTMLYNQGYKKNSIIW